jgi:hypothetical protein
MSVDLLEDQILNKANLRVGKYRKTVPARIVRLKHLTD